MADDNFLAAMMVFAILGVFAVTLSMDTNPFTGVRFRTLGARLLDWFDGLPIWSKLGDD